MKKLSLVLVMVFAVSWVMAQQVSTVGQNGSGNTATVTQTGADGNNSNINMAGNTNTATVSQLNGGFAGDHHDAEILITGNSNTASIDQQLQANGDAKITQIGNSNTATIVENGNLYATHPDAPGYDAWAFQQGSSNIINMSIFGTNAAAFANQVGNNNIISQTLGEAVGQKVENSTVYASQVGNANTAIQYTEGEGFAGGIQAFAEVERIEQNGNGNWAQQRQYDDLLPAHDNYARVIQNGDGNASIQNQAGNNLQSYVTQNGADNSTTVQIGSFNIVTVTQN
jgi:hypothetical protein